MTVVGHEPQKPTNKLRHFLGSKLTVFSKRLFSYSRPVRMVIFAGTFAVVGGVFVLTNFALSKNSNPCSKLSNYGHVAPGLFYACQYQTGVYELAYNNGSRNFSHGGDVIIGNGAQTAQPGTAGAASNGTTITAPAVMPACATDYYFRVIYAVTAGYTANTTDINNIKNAVEVSNGFLHNQDVNVNHNLYVNYKVLCSGGQIAVTQVNLSQSDPSFQDVVNDLQAQGYNAPNVKYWVYVTAQGGDYSKFCGTTAGCAYGLGSMYYGASGDDALSTSNPSDGNFPLYAVSFNSFSPFLWAHEATHTMGAVQLSAPNSNGSGHCTIDYDLMCLGYTPSGNPITCGNIAYDCVLNNYYNPVPAAGSYLATHWNIGNTINRFLSIEGGATAPATDGYWLVASDGGVFTFGNAPFYGSTGGQALNKPMVGMAEDPATGGYWLVAADGGIFTFNAPFYGSTGGQILNKPVVGMAATSNGGGYWLVAADGGIFTFGNAPFYGSMGGKTLNKPVVGMAADPATGGYWLVAADGGIFTFNAPFYGSTGSLTLNQPIVGMAATANGGGYWLVGADGGIFTFGNAPYYGSVPGLGYSVNNIVGIGRLADGGYNVAASDGTTYSFTPSGAYVKAPMALNKPIVGTAGK